MYSTIEFFQTTNTLSQISNYCGITVIAKSNPHDKQCRYMIDPGSYRKTNTLHKLGKQSDRQELRSTSNTRRRLSI